MAKKKKISGLSVAIVSLNIVIVGIIILLIVLIYLHMIDDAENSRVETTTVPEISAAETDPSDAAPPSETESETNNTADAAVNPEETAPKTEDDPLISPSYDPAFFQNDLFIGDSISTGLYLYDFLDKENVFAEVGLNPESAETKEVDGVTCIQKVQAMNPKHIFIMLGSNGLAFLDADYMAAKMADLIEKLEAACPTAQICIISIPPVTKAHDAEGSETMAKVNAYNAALKSLCSSGGYTYIDICTTLLDDEGYFAEKYAEEDGLHFMGNTYKILLSAAQNAAQ